MNFRVIDFDLLTRSFQPYIDGFNRIETEKKKLLEEVEPLKNEMKSLITRNSSSLILDEMNQKMSVERVKAIQQELMQKDYEYKSKLSSMRDELNTTVYDQLSDMISEWCEKNNIDVVIGKMEVVFSNPEFEATSQIIDIIKQKGLFNNIEQTELKESF